MTRFKFVAIDAYSNYHTMNTTIVADEEASKLKNWHEVDDNDFFMIRTQIDKISEDFRKRQIIEASQRLAIIVDVSVDINDVLSIAKKHHEETQRLAAQYREEARIRQEQKAARDAARIAKAKEMSDKKKKEKELKLFNELKAKLEPKTNETL